MKKQMLMLTVMLILSMLLCGVNTSSAVMTVKVMDYTGPHGLGGGEFTLKNVGMEAIGIVQPGKTWQSFCVEYNEHISIGSSYEVNINDGAVNGGFSGQTQSGYDPLDSRTAYLFSKFSGNTLSNYTGDAQSAKNLQVAIWSLEGELDATTIDIIGDAYYAQAQSWLTESQNAVSNNQWVGLGNVRVLNMYQPGHLGDPAWVRQDQLVIVPAPGAFLLGSIGVGLVGWFRRRTLIGLTV